MQGESKGKNIRPVPRAHAVIGNMRPVWQQFAEGGRALRCLPPPILWTSIAVLAVILLMGVQQIFSPDIGIHLAQGRWILHHRAFPSTDVFTYTINSHADTDLWWIYQLALVLIDRWWGAAGLVISNALLILASFVLLVLRSGAKEKASLAWMPLVLLLGAVAWNFEIRPHVFSWLYLNLLLLVLETYRRDRSATLLPLPLLMLLWINSHPLGLIGFGAIGAWILGGRIADGHWDRHLLQWSGISVVVLIINPYGPAGLSLPLTQLGIISGGGNAQFKDFIGEFVSPFTTAEYKAGGRWFFLQSLFPFHLFTALLLAAMSLSLRRERVPELLATAVFLVLFAMAQKNFGFLFFVSAPLLCTVLAERLSHVRRARVNEKERRKHTAASTRRTIYVPTWLPWATALGISALLLPTIPTDAYYTMLRAPLRFGVAYDESRLPVDAVAFLRERKLEGRLFNHHDFGGYLMANVPQPVFIDGRHHTLGPRFYSEYRTSYSPEGMRLLLDKYRPDIAIFPYGSAVPWLQYFSADSEWRLVHFDDVAAVYLRAGYAPDVRALDEATVLKQLSAFDTARVDAMLKKSWPSGIAWLAQSVATRQKTPFGESNRAFLCYAHGWHSAAQRYGLEAINRASSESATLFFNLGNYFFAGKEYASSAVCYRRVVALENNPDAEERLRVLRGMR
jgi:hypothetical protein